MPKINIKKLIISKRDSIVPDVLEGVMQKAGALALPARAINNKNRSVLKMFAAICAAVMVFASGLLVYSYRNSEKSVIYLDINPSIGLVINMKDTIKRVIQPSGETFPADELNLVGKPYEEAVVDIVDYAVAKNYITADGADNALSLSVSSEDKNKEKIVGRMTEKINRYLENKRIRCEVLKNFYSKDIENNAKDENISPGKLAIIKKIISCDDSYTIEELKGESIKELNIILKTLAEERTEIDNNNQNGNEEKGAHNGSSNTGGAGDSNTQNNNEDNGMPDGNNTSPGGNGRTD